MLFITIGVLSLQGAFIEHLKLLRAAAVLLETKSNSGSQNIKFDFAQIRNPEQLSRCDALIIPGGESTTMSLVAAQSKLLEPLRDFVKVQRKSTWGTCAGLILLAEAANATKQGGQELIGGLDVRVNRNHFGRQVESFQAELKLPFLADTASGDCDGFPGIFIRAPIIERILPAVRGVPPHEQQTEMSIVAPAKSPVKDAKVEVMGLLPGRLTKAKQQAGATVAADEDTGDIVAVRQGNVFGTSFHPELSNDLRIHVWWLQQVVAAMHNSQEMPG